MIKFFRNIRQNLLNEGKTSKYLKYAIGEIVLVVIGILIAIQINGYVTKKKIQEDNKVFLTKIIQELKQNKDRIHRLMGDSGVVGRFTPLKTVIENHNKLLIKTYKGLDKTDLSFIINALRGSSNSTLNLNNSTYEELINTGKLYTLGSNSLITAIVKYYKRCEREDYYNKQNTQNALEGSKIMDKNLGKLRLDFIVDSTQFSLNNYSWFFDKSSQPYQDMQIGLSKFITGQNGNYRKMEEIIKYSDSLILKINRELNQSL